MDERQRLFRRYWATIERILDLDLIEGDRSFAKKKLHNSFKKSLGIVRLSRMDTQELRELVENMNNFFPLPHNLINNERKS